MAENIKVYLFRDYSDDNIDLTASNVIPFNQY